MKGLDLGHMGSLLQSCMRAKALKPGKQIHALLLSSGADTNVESLNSKLVGVYAGCGDVESATVIFEQIHRPSVFAWNWMISASAFQGNCENAIRYFSRLLQAGIFPNRFTFSYSLKACVGMMDINKGKEFHCAIYRMGFESDVSVTNALIDMYSKCGGMDFARRLFDGMSQRDVATWTSMICGYSFGKNLEQSAILFEQIKLENLEPNHFTWNAMIAGYAQNGDCNRAFVLFSRMKETGLFPDLVTWNAMIAGFTQNHESTKAIELFREMLVSGLKPNPVTISGLLPAFGLMGSLHRGRQIHGLIYRTGLDINVFTSTALIDMYSKCGSVKDACNVFDRIAVKNVASWNAMIGCYGKHGMVDASIELFKIMQEESVKANQVTFTCLLSACGHGGLVEKGLEIFRSMKEKYSTEFSNEHYACIVDLLCRSGRLEEAYDLVKEIPMEINDSIAGAFLNGCRIHGRSDLAKQMAEMIVAMELKRPGGFVTLSNIYAADGEWEGVETVRRLMKEKSVVKKPGYSWLEKKDELVRFKVGKSVF
ncbi:pentatricopeptide repeat-containing protein At5g59600-like [Telopea speciosissima]|uniref:pentatricopeptide repeat-containing protein At5g59600-like n=1 Tax=Telopea speciosissima TaxID=54955 RepID=UPI001CC786E1|nr:pentatricopeptide repeat-containing protein At5g59600-like [Telopea speciosissima]